MQMSQNRKFRLYNTLKSKVVKSTARSSLMILALDIQPMSLRDFYMPRQSGAWENTRRDILVNSNVYYVFSRSIKGS